MDEKRKGLNSYKMELIVLLEIDVALSCANFVFRPSLYTQSVLR